MLRQVRSSLPKFRTANFVAGFNVVLADAVKDADETESTNGLGKTTLIRIIQFCLGGSASHDKVLSHPKLEKTAFGITFVHQGIEVAVDRNTSEETVSVTSEFLDGAGVEVIERRNGVSVISEASWKQALSAKFLADAVIANSPLYAPSFREVVLYFARIGKPAFVDPQQVFQGQSGNSKRSILSYLTGLNWTGQRLLDDLNNKRNQINAAIKALEDAKDSADEHTIGDLEAERVVLDGAIDFKRNEVSTFNVREDYRSLEQDLTGIDLRLHDEINQNYADQRLLQYYQRSAREFPKALSMDAVSILREAGAVFKDDALRSIDEVSAFQAQVYKNRKEFLAVEIARLKRQIADRGSKIDELALGKTSVLRILGSSGALETLIELQRDLSNLEAKRVALGARIEERKRYDRRKDDLSAAIFQQRALLKRDLDDRRATVDEAVGLFASYTKALYGVPGKLVVDVKNSGYSFQFSIAREGSDGVDQMVVFCFDLTVATLRARRRLPFNLLIHDSSVFADVDPHQYGAALQLAKSAATNEGFQYICCLNSGALPTDHLGELDLEKHVSLRLLDTDDGTLLGMRLPPREK